MRDVEKYNINKESRKHAALDFVNTIRKKYGLLALHELCKGEKGNSNYCPISKSIKQDYSKMFNKKNLNVHVTGSKILFIYVEDHFLTYEEISIPNKAGQFISSFDEGHYPELEI